MGLSPSTANDQNNPKVFILESPLERFVSASSVLRTLTTLRRFGRHPKENTTETDLKAPESSIPRRSSADGVDDDRLSIKRSPSFLTKYYQGTDDNVNKRVSKRPSFLQELKHLILREDTEDSEDQIVSSKLLSALRWRRTVKSFQHGCIDYSVVIEAATLAPSEFGLTPYRVYVVEDPEMKKKLRASSFSQPQVEEAAVLLYFVVITDPKLATAKLIKKMNYDISSPELALHIRMTYDNQSPEQFTAYARAQAHTALGFAIALAAEQRIASCPIEGFKPARIAKILGLSESELPVVCLALGTQHADPSKAMPLAEARFTADDIVVRTFTM